MLEPPNINDGEIIDCLSKEYSLHVTQLAFLPLGADRNTAAYRVYTGNDKTYFLKLRSGIFDETSVTLPKYLSDRGIEQIIPPLISRSGQLWANLGAFKTILYSYIEGRDGYEVKLAPRQWRDFGKALKKIHSAALPPELRQHIQQERYSAKWRELVKAFLKQVEEDAFTDPVAVQVAAFLKARRGEILDLVGRAERHARTLLERAPQFILCHSDLHPGNIFIDERDNIYLVDWDNPIMACKERDLMFIGGGLGFKGSDAKEEETLFYQGYGPAQVDAVVLAYYRYERIVQDIAVFCEELLLTVEGGEDRPRSLQFLMSHFLPGGTIATAYEADRA
jgi:spectinomycin phosphotransferase